MQRAEWLVSIIKERGYTRGVELGVKRGDTLKHILAECPSVEMVGVDIWQTTPGYEAWDHDEYMRCAMAVAEAYPRRLTLVREYTWDAADSFDDASFDFIFVDGDHRTESVLRDIEAWRPKIRDGGLLCGHDVGWDSVQKALDQAVPDYTRVGHDGCWACTV
jgi:predicted O-methyltransferase YrrM